MSQLTLSIQPQVATKLILKQLPSRRMRDVLEKRFGLKGGKRHTLEAIGKEYRITRERVRQIEADALKTLGKGNALEEQKDLFREMENHLRERGGAMAERDLMTTLVGERNHPHALFLLTISQGIHDFPETDAFYKRWALDKEALSRAEQIAGSVVQELEEHKAPVAEADLYNFAARVVKDTTGGAPAREVLAASIGISRMLSKNPYGEYGLVSWPTINPRGVKDKAYAVLSKETKPLHFREVAKAIDRAGWSRRRAHPQTVHNELIKDSRFVLVGRGMYALKDWGYEPGVVRDVVASVLKSAGRALSKDEIVSLVSEKRLVKPQTVLLNLQNKSLFKRDDVGKYTLV